MLRTVQLLPLKGFRHWASTPGVSPRRRQSATGPPGSYPDRTSTGRRQQAYDSRSATSRRPPSLLGARKIEAKAMNRGAPVRRAPLQVSHPSFVHTVATTGNIHSISQPQAFANQPGVTSRFSHKNIQARMTLRYNNYPESLHPFRRTSVEAERR